MLQAHSASNQSNKEPEDSYGTAGGGLSSEDVLKSAKEVI